MVNAPCSHSSAGPDPKYHWILSGVERLSTTPVRVLRGSMGFKGYRDAIAPLLVVSNDQYFDLVEST